jgi:CDP-diacylglycerol--inositol 3-phosphatidyltransferase
VLGSLGLFRLILYVSAPVAFAKAAISGIHLITAAQNIGNIDADDRNKTKSN